MPSLFAELIAPLAAGLAVFLFGMKTIEVALYQWTGELMKQALRQLTRTPFRGLLAGTATTALLQSSSAVTVITIGFVNAGVLTFPQTLGIILGTNIGSCLTTELLGIRMSGSVMPVLLVSFSAWLLTWLPVFDRAEAFPKSIRALRGLTLSAAGFCCILLGLQMMQSIVPYLQERGLLAWFVEQSQRSLLWGIIAGAGLTAVIHSSAASIAITMGLASLGLIPIDLGIAIVLGCNIGTCATAMIAGIGGSRFGHFVAWSHLLLNIGGTLLFYPFIATLQTASAMFAADAAGQIARAQTLFNLVSSLIALPLCYLPFFKKIQPEPNPR